MDTWRLHQSQFALIIQGPLVSQGYNCVSNIFKILDCYATHFSQVIISTWAGECERVGGLSLEQYQNVFILENKDPGQPKMIGAESVDNRVRQVYSSYQALQLIDTKDNCIVVKIRTDQFVNLDELLESLSSQNEQMTDYLTAGQRGFLFFLHGNIYVPYFAADFIWAGYGVDLEQFLLSQLNLSYISFLSGRFIPEPDLMLKYSYARLKKQIFPQIPALKFFPRIQSERTLVRHYNPDILELWEWILKHSIAFLPRNLTTSLVWRGKSWEEIKTPAQTKRRIYQNEWLEARSDTKIFYKNSEAGWMYGNNKDVICDYLVERPFEMKFHIRHPLFRLLRLYRKMQERNPKPLYLDSMKDNLIDGLN